MTNDEDHAREFNEKNKRLAHDIQRAYGFFQSLINRKIQLTSELIGLENKNEYNEQVTRRLSRLEKILRVEDQYLVKFTYRLRRFQHHIDYFKYDMLSRPVFKSVPKYMHLTQKYLSQLEGICDNIAGLMGRAADVNAREISHVHSSLGHVYTRDYVTNFVREFNAYRNDLADEGEIAEIVDTIKTRDQQRKQTLGKLKIAYEALDPELKFMAKGLAGIGIITQKPINTIILGSILLLSYLGFGAMQNYFVRRPISQKTPSPSYSS